MKSRILAIVFALLGVSSPVFAQPIGQPQGITVVDSGTACVTAPTACAIYALDNQTSSVTLSVSGTWTGTLTFEATNNDGSWTSVSATNQATGAMATTTTAVGLFGVANSGFVKIRARATGAITGTATVTAAKGQGNAAAAAAGAGGSGLTDTQLRATPVPVTPAANSAVNVAQINGATTTMGNGVSGTGVQRVTIASDSTGVVGLSTGTNTIGSVKITDGTTTVITDPCQGNAKVYLPISQAANAQLITGTSAKKIYICHIMFNGSDAENISIVAGTGSVCATNTVAVFGSTTAANGMNFAANSGTSLGMGGFAIAATTVNADNLCLFQSGSGRVAGGMTYVVQ